MRPFTTAAYLFANRYSRGRIHAALRDEVRRLDGLAPPPDVLNVGSGGTFGALIGTLRRANVTSIDADPSRNPDAVMDVRHMNEFADGSFDHVFMMEVLEHVETPQAALDEVRRVLRPGGTLLLSTPFGLEVHAEPHDYYRFTRDGLAFLLDDFESVQITPDASFVQTMMVLWLRLCMSPHRIDRAISVTVLGLIVIFFPFVWLLDRCVRTDALPKGYIVRASRSSGSGARGDGAGRWPETAQGADGDSHPDELSGRPGPGRTKSAEAGHERQE